MIGPEVFQVPYSAWPDRAGFPAIGIEGWGAITLRADPGQLLLVRFVEGGMRYQYVVDEEGMTVDYQSVPVGAEWGGET